MTKAYCSLDCARTDDGFPGPPMFKDLRAGTKFLILCGVSLALTSVATYALLAEKQIAISFAHSELVGSKYLAMLRPIYRTVLELRQKRIQPAVKSRYRLMSLRRCRVPTKKPRNAANRQCCSIARRGAARHG